MTGGGGDESGGRGERATAMMPMDFPDVPRNKNRRMGIFLFLFFLAFTALAVVFVILRKYGYA